MRKFVKMNEKNDKILLICSNRDSFDNYFHIFQQDNRVDGDLNYRMFGFCAE